MTGVVPTIKAPRACRATRPRRGDPVDRPDGSAGVDPFKADVGGLNGPHHRRRFHARTKDDDGSGGTVEKRAGARC